MIDNQKIVEILTSYFGSGVYCDTCANNGDDDICVYCHRKSMNWACSDVIINEIADKICTECQR